jgi:hypothetical protein
MSSSMTGEQRFEDGLHDGLARGGRQAAGQPIAHSAAVERTLSRGRLDRFDRRFGGRSPGQRGYGRPRLGATTYPSRLIRASGRVRRERLVGQRNLLRRA